MAEQRAGQNVAGPELGRSQLRPCTSLQESDYTVSQEQMQRTDLQQNLAGLNPHLSLLLKGTRWLCEEVPGERESLWDRTGQSRAGREGSQLGSGRRSHSLAKEALGDGAELPPAVLDQVHLLAHHHVIQLLPLLRNHDIRVALHAQLQACVET